MSKLTRAILHSIAFCGGAITAFGVMGGAMGFIGWLRGGFYTPGPLLGAVLVPVAIGLGLRRRPMSPVMRTWSNAGVWLSAGLLSFCAVGSGSIDTKEAAYGAALRSDLRNLVSDEDDFRRDSGRYSPVAPRTFRSSTGVLPPVIAMTGDGWTARVTHTQVKTTCAIFVGTTPIAPAVEERAPACSRPPFEPSRYLVSGYFLAAGIVLGVLARTFEARALRRGHATVTE